MKLYMNVIAIFCAIGTGIIAAKEPSDMCTEYNALQGQLTHLHQVYAQHLGIFTDPFLLTFTVHEANTVYETLLRRSDGFTCENTPLFTIQQALNERLMRPITFDTFTKNLMLGILTDSHDLLARSSYEDVGLNQLQSNHMALDRALEYMRYIPHQCTHNDAPPDNTTQPDDAQKPKEDSVNKDQDEPDYPELSDFYTPHTKELAGQDQKNKNKNIVAQVNIKASLFGQKAYSRIIRNHHTPLQVASDGWNPTYHPACLGDQPQTILKINPLSRTSGHLFLPSGYIPLQPQSPDTKITYDTNGSFIFSSSGTPHILEIPLIKRPEIPLTTFQLEHYIHKVGFALSEWPDDIQTNLLHAYNTKSHDVKTIAQAVQKYIAHAYIYSTQTRIETDPIDALRAGQFQCDMAAYIMAALLRDAFNIPCRIISGYRGKMHTEDRGVNSYLVLPADGHAWVEVFHGNAWHPYDPTPIKKDKEDDNKTAHEEYKDIPTDDSQASQNQEDPPLDTAVEQEAEQAGDTDASESQARTTDTEPYIFDDLTSTLTDVDFNDVRDTNILRQYILKLLLIDMLNPLQPSEEINSKLNLFKNIMNFAPATLQNAIHQGLDIHKKPHDPLVVWLKSTRTLAHIQDINITHQDISSMIKMLNLYAQVIDENSIKQTLSDLIGQLHEALLLMDPFKHPRAGDMALVSDFKTSSPALVWTLIQRDYGIQEIAPTAHVESFARDLRSGKHNDKLLVNYLYDHTNFILNASARSGTYDIKTWLRINGKTGRDLLPAQRVDDLRHALFTNPRMSPIESLMQGYAYVISKRQKVTLPTRTQNQEAERITIVGFDTSGSMEGDNAEFQAALIAAFVSRALNDISPLGHPRHRVLLVPFNDQVGEPIKITDTQTALEVIKNHQRSLAKAAGGTDIQAFLLQAMNLIAQSQNSKKPFEAANIILMSDGQSSIDYNELVNARSSIHRSTPLQTMFVALGSSNPDLQRFALESKKMGAEAGFYKEFDGHDISHILNVAKQIDMTKYGKTYYTTESATKLPTVITQHISRAIEYADLLTQQIMQLMHYENRYEASAFLHAHKPKEAFTHRPLESWLYEIRQLCATQKVLHNERTINFILYHLLINLEALTHVSYNTFTHHETEHLLHLINNPFNQGNL